MIAPLEERVALGLRFASSGAGRRAPIRFCSLSSQRILLLKASWLPWYPGKYP
jgi:hypothetical protein